MFTLWKIIGDTNYLQRVQESITAAVEGMIDTARVGLVTFDHRIGLWNMENSSPENKNILTKVHHIPISSSTVCGVAIDEILSIDQFLVPVCNIHLL